MPDNEKLCTGCDYWQMCVGSTAAQEFQKVVYSAGIIEDDKDGGLAIYKFLASRCKRFVPCKE